MRFGRTLIALLAVTALAAFAAGTAQAAWQIEGEEWTTTESFKAKTPESSPVATLQLIEGSVIRIELRGTGLECVGCTISKGTTASAGKLKLTGITVYINGVAEPNCTVNGGFAIESMPLRGEVIMDPTAGSTAVFDKLVPVLKSGELFVVAFSGSKCPFNEGETLIKGSLCGEIAKEEGVGLWSPMKTNELGTVLSLRYSAEQQATGECALTWAGGTKPARLLSVINAELSGPNAGKPWGVG